MCFYSERGADSIKFHAKHTFLVPITLCCHGNLAGGDLMITKFTPQTTKLASFLLESFLSIAVQYTLAYIFTRQLKTVPNIYQKIDNIASVDFF